MKNNPLYWTAALIALSALQACSDKTVNAPAPAVVAAPAVAAAPAAPAKTASTKPLKPLLRAATMECADRKIVLDATCHDLIGPDMLQCSRQTLVVSETESGKVLGTRNFVPKVGSDAVSMIEDKVGEMTCVTTSTGAKYIVTNMFNGGTCEGCEWHEVYSWEGILLGSNRDKTKPIQVVDAAVAALTEKDVDRVTGVNDVAGFYSEPAKK